MPSSCRSVYSFRVVILLMLNVKEQCLLNSSFVDAAQVLHSTDLKNFLLK